MEVLIRMIERNKWKDYIPQYAANGKVASFPVTNNLCTCEENRLSVWEANLEDQDSFEKTILTIAASRPHLQTLDIGVLRKDILIKSGIQLEKNDGTTELVKFKDRHWDLKELDIDNIKVISSEILDYMKNSKSDEWNKRIRFNESALIKLFIKKYDEKSIDITDLNESFQRKIQKKIDANKRASV